MKYRLHFESLDIETDDIDNWVEGIYKYLQKTATNQVSGGFYIPDIRKIVPIDNEGLPKSLKLQTAK